MAAGHSIHLCHAPGHCHCTGLPKLWQSLVSLWWSCFPKIATMTKMIRICGGAVAPGCHGSLKEILLFSGAFVCLQACCALWPSWLLLQQTDHSHVTLIDSTSARLILMCCSAKPLLLFSPFSSILFTSFILGLARPGQRMVACAATAS